MKKDIKRIEGYVKSRFVRYKVFPCGNIEHCYINIYFSTITLVVYYNGKVMCNGNILKKATASSTCELFENVISELILIDEDIKKVMEYKGE